MNELAYIPRHSRKCVKYKNLIKFNDFKDNEKLNQACLSAYKNVQMGSEWSHSIHAVQIKKKKAYTLKTSESVIVNNSIIKNRKSYFKTSW